MYVYFMRNKIFIYISLFGILTMFLLSNLHNTQAATIASSAKIQTADNEVVNLFLRVPVE